MKIEFCSFLREEQEDKYTFDSYHMMILSVGPIILGTGIFLCIVRISFEHHLLISLLTGSDPSSPADGYGGCCDWNSKSQSQDSFHPNSSSHVPRPSLTFRAANSVLTTVSQVGIRYRTDPQFDHNPPHHRHLDDHAPSESQKEQEEKRNEPREYEEIAEENGIQNSESSSSSVVVTLPDGNGDQEGREEQEESEVKADSFQTNIPNVEWSQSGHRREEESNDRSESEDHQSENPSVDGITYV